MTVLEYLSNPYGKGSAATGVGHQRQLLEEQYKTLKSSIGVSLYLYRNTAIYHVNVPSHKDTHHTYDVIIEIPINDMKHEVIDLTNSHFRAFSNCPSFIFTYAHVFRGRKMLCEWLVKKYNPEVRKKFPKISNPNGLIGYERSIYLALRYIKAHGWLFVTEFKNAASTPKSYGEIAAKIRSQEEIMANYSTKLKAKSLATTKKKEEVERDSPKKKRESSSTITKVAKTKTMKTSKSSSVKSVSKVGRVSTKNRH